MGQTIDSKVKHLTFVLSNSASMLLRLNSKIMSYKITILAPAQDRYIDLQPNESGKTFNSWTVDPIDTGSLDMDVFDSVFGKTAPEDESMRHTVITNENDLAAVVAITKAYHDCPVSVEIFAA